MAKRKLKNKVYEPVVRQEAGEGGENVTVVRVVEKQYKMVPVDLEAHADLMSLCAMRGFGQRGQGAMVKKLVKDELARISVKADQR
jgi:hypothetical protein